MYIWECDATTARPHPTAAKSKMRNMVACVAKSLIFNFGTYDATMAGPSVGQGWSPGWVVGDPPGTNKAPQICNFCVGFVGTCRTTILMFLVFSTN